ncbi:hypothetical protein PY093_20645 [Cytobacillus sp. S13-E01]|uniref:hypothetical protein n=1 Tax=Cytobacillus sp. S13-E01 TaxID=3031326 RepID=UPI0023D85F5C|nr:hypothetical protein [Cytobacillus sp. S13-E01]MDF0729019.1 hypothetical protein [Cytobacillus sp. S13-E01]
MHSKPRKRNFDVKAFYDTLIAEGKAEVIKLPSDPVEAKQLMEEKLKEYGYVKGEFLVENRCSSCNEVSPKLFNPPSTFINPDNTILKGKFCKTCVLNVIEAGYKKFFVVFDNNEPVVLNVKEDVNRPNNPDCEQIIQNWITDNYGPNAKCNWWEIKVCDSYDI